MILDIETFALDDAAQFIEDPTAPAHYKDPEKIAAYVEQKRAEAVSRCALDLDLCRVVAIGIHGKHPQVELAYEPSDERDLLRWLWKESGHADRFIGFNILSFDLPVLIRRSQYLGVPVPSLATSLDRYRTPHIDLLERLSFNGKVKYRGLDFYCKRFGITVDDPVNGKEIDALVRAGDWTAVANHCRADVERTRRLAARLGYVDAVAEVA